jgi:hypothetical protein
MSLIFSYVTLGLEVVSHCEGRIRLGVFENRGQRTKYLDTEKEATEGENYVMWALQFAPSVRSSRDK